MWPRGQIIPPQPRPHSFWPRLLASGLGLIEIGLVTSNIYSAHDIIANIAIDNHFCCLLAAYWTLCTERQYLSLHAHTHWVVLWRVWPRPRPWPHAQLASLTSLDTMVRSTITETAPSSGNVRWRRKTAGIDMRQNDVAVTVCISVRENVCNNSKNVKSHVFLNLKKT